VENAVLPHPAASVVLAPSALMYRVAQVAATHPWAFSAVTTLVVGDLVLRLASTVGDLTLLVEVLLVGWALGVAVLVTVGGEF